MQEIAKIKLIKTSPAEGWINSLRKETRLPYLIKSSPYYEEKFRLLSTSHDFILTIGELRSHFGIYPHEMMDIKNCLVRAENLYKDGARKRLFLSKTGKLLKNSRMSDRWREAVEYFLLFNDYPDHLFPPSFEILVHEEKNGLKLSLQIFRSTTSEDIKRNWSIIAEYQSILPTLLKEKPLRKDLVVISINKRTKKSCLHHALTTGRKRSTVTQEKLIHIQRLKGTRKQSEIAQEIGLPKYDTPRIGAYDRRYKNKLEAIEFY